MNVCLCVCVFVFVFFSIYHDNHLNSTKEETSLCMLPFCLRLDASLHPYEREGATAGVKRVGIDEFSVYTPPDSGRQPHGGIPRGTAGHIQERMSRGLLRRGHRNAWLQLPAKRNLATDRHVRRTSSAYLRLAILVQQLGDRLHHPVPKARLHQPNHELAALPKDGSEGCDVRVRVGDGTAAFAPIRSISSSSATAAAA